MIKFMVMLHKPQNLEAFENAYQDFLALAERMPHLRRRQAVLTIGSPQPHVPYYRILELYFDSMPQLQESLLSDVGQEAGNELGRFTDGFDILYAEVYEEATQDQP